MQKSGSLRQASLCFLLKEFREEKQILLALKKRGFGKGRWNSVGGKVNFEKGDRGVKNCAFRETREEIFIEPKRVEKVAIMDFYFPYVPAKYDFDQQVHVFFIYDWSGEPHESEEVKPCWFDENKLPFSEMWLDDAYWLPRVLRGEKVKGIFYFDEEGGIENKKLDIVENLEF